MIPLVLIGAHPDLERRYAGWPQHHFTDLAQALAALPTLPTPVALIVAYDATTPPLLNYLRPTAHLIIATIPERLPPAAVWHFYTTGDFLVIGTPSPWIWHMLDGILAQPPHRARWGATHGAA